WPARRRQASVTSRICSPAARRSIPAPWPRCSRTGRPPASPTSTVPPRAPPSRRPGRSPRCRQGRGPCRSAAPAPTPPPPAPRAPVLERALRPLPAGVTGELWLGGDGLARGDLGRPQEPAERFRPDPFAARPGDRLYRTGDLVRWDFLGALEFIGRDDAQVKIR